MRHVITFDATVTQDWMDSDWGLEKIFHDWIRDDLQPGESFRLIDYVGPDSAGSLTVRFELKVLRPIPEQWLRWMFCAFEEQSHGPEEIAHRLVANDGTVLTRPDQEGDLVVEPGRALDRSYYAEPL